MQYPRILAVCAAMLATTAHAEEWHKLEGVEPVQLTHAIVCNDRNLAEHIAARFGESPEKGWWSFAIQRGMAKVRKENYMRSAGQIMASMNIIHMMNAAMMADVTRCWYASKVFSLRAVTYVSDAPIEGTIKKHADMSGRAVRFLIPIGGAPPYEWNRYEEQN